MIRVRRRKIGRNLQFRSVADVIIQFSPFLRKIWPTLLAAGLGMIAHTILQILRPWPIKIVVDVLTGKGGQGTFPTLLHFGERSTKEVLLIASSAILLIAILAGLATYVQRYFGARGGQLLAFRVRKDLYRHIHRLTLSHHDRAKTGDFLLRLTADMNLLRNLLVPSALALASQILVLVGIAVVMLRVDLLITLTGLAIVPFLFFTTISFAGRIRLAVRKQREREGKLAATAAESVASIPLVKVHSAEQFEDNRFLADQRRSFRQGLRATKLQAALERRIEIFTAVGTCLVLWVGSNRALEGKITTGDLILAISYLAMLYKPIQRFSRLTSRLAKGIVAAERIAEIFNLEGEDLHAPGTVRPRIEGRIRFDSVTFGYEPGTKILHDLNLEIEPGETIALVGPSGSGKTTIARLIPRLYEAGAGTISIDGIPLRQVELAHLRDQIAFVLQETLILGISVRENISYGLAETTDEELERAARQAMIHDRILELPEGYETVLAENGVGLSGGERQRISLARAFLSSSPVVILDEPDTYLDPIARRAFWDAARELVRGRTAIMIVHSVEHLDFVDRFILIERGRVAGQGTRKEMMAGSSRFRALFDNDEEGARRNVSA